jgi:hypothetical protein
MPNTSLVALSTSGESGKKKDDDSLQGAVG